MTAPPQFSPDGKWWWDGTQWVPAAQAPQPPPQAWPPVTPEAQQTWPPAGAQPQASPYPPQQQAYYPPPQKTDGKAIGSIIASVLWLCGIGSIVGIILGHSSRSQARREGRAPAGLALAGVIIGYVGLAGTVGIGITAYTLRDPIVSSAKNSVELQSASEAQQSFHRATGRYAQTLEQLRPYGYDDYDGKVDVVVIRADDSGYCMSAHIIGQELYVSDIRPEVTNHRC